MSSDENVRAWLAVWAGWTALALFFAVSTSLTYRSTGRPANWALTIKRSLSEWWLWAAADAAGRVAGAALSAARPRLWPTSRFTSLAARSSRSSRRSPIALIFALLTGFWMYWLVSTLALNSSIYGAIVAAAHGVEYYRRSREREHLEARLAETRLQLLGMQLQPHFLFNTLNTIAEMVHEDPDKADTMIAGLSDLLRRTLDSDGAGDPARRRDRPGLALPRHPEGPVRRSPAACRLAIDDAAPDARVPALLLQPIVENAIRHGLAARLDAGRIDIEARPPAACW